MGVTVSRFSKRTVNVMISIKSHLLPERECAFASSQRQFRSEDLTVHELRILEYDVAQATLNQQALLPRQPFRSSGCEIHYHYAPVGPVGGDCCDLFPYGGGLLFLLGDVSGKGLAASLLMSHLTGAFRSLASADRPIGFMMEAANRIFWRSTQLGQLATMVVGHITPNGSVKFVNAGHMPMLHLSSSGVSRKSATAVPLGTFSNTRFRINRLSLDPGDTLLLYTDGVTESRNSAGEEYGVVRLYNVAAQHHLSAPGVLISECLSDVHSFTAGTDPADDMTLLAIQRSG
jgi:sigma-B regulation protein RsbU (phosphoserine phosphatase)